MTEHGGVAKMSFEARDAPLRTHRGAGVLGVPTDGTDVSAAGVPRAGG